jgi:hypothetical protein
MKIGDFVKAIRRVDGKIFVGRIDDISKNLPFPYEIQCFDGSSQLFREDELIVLSDGEAMISKLEY